MSAKDEKAGWQAIWKVGDIGKTVHEEGYKCINTFYRVIKVTENELHAVRLKKLVYSSIKLGNDGDTYQFVRPSTEEENKSPIMFRFGSDALLDLKIGVNRDYHDSIGTFWFFERWQ